MNFVNNAFGLKKYAFGLKSEKFDVHEGPESSILTSPDLYYYYDYPEIFVVPQDFCQ